jgi:esterase
VTKARRQGFTPELQSQSHPGESSRDARTPQERVLETPRGAFRALEWPGEGVPVLLLHGLSGVAEVWEPTVQELPANRHIVAIDQRGHGESHPTFGGYAIRAFVADTLAVIDALGLDRPHLVGHSMGARVAIAFVAKFPEVVRSVAIVDIGPEQWRENWESTLEAFAKMPQRFENAEAALAYASRGREMSESARRIFLARLKQDPDGSLTWRADLDALNTTVRLHRSRNYWREWAAISAPLLMIRGGESRELRRNIYETMRMMQQSATYKEFDGVGHNIPLIAPERLANELNAFWAHHEGGTSRQ